LVITQVAEPLHNGQTASASLPISTSGPVADGVPSLIVQIAVRTSIEVFYFQVGGRVLRRSLPGKHADNTL
jgi:hypothetical protein